MSLRELEKRSGVSHTYLSSLEKGADPRTGKGRKPTPETLEKLAPVLGVTYSYLMKEAGYMSEADLVRHQSAVLDFGTRLKADLKEYLPLPEPIIAALTSPVDIHESLNDEFIGVLYKRHKLSLQDRQRAIAVLDALFPGAES